jgi:hypothetical protein
VLPSLLLMVAFLLYIRNTGIKPYSQPPANMAHGDCTLVVTSPLVYACQKRVYVVENGVWRDIGPVTLVPSVPAG